MGALQNNYENNIFKKHNDCCKSQCHFTFSQSLFTLNLIEELLSKRKVPRDEMDEHWCKNKTYFSKSHICYSVNLNAYMTIFVRCTVGWPGPQ